MRKVVVYFKTDYLIGEFKEENVVYKNRKIEITNVELVEFENGYLKIIFENTQYAGGESRYNLDMKYLDMKYIEKYYIF